MNSAIRKFLWYAAAGAGAVVAARTMIRLHRAIDFRGKVVLITGGSRGLGLVMARQLARQGASLTLCARDSLELERAGRTLTDSNADVLTIPCDVTDQEQVESMIRACLDRFGRIDVLINNAGAIQVGPFEVTTEEDYEVAIRTHFWGPLYSTLAVIPWMVRQGGGRIVNVASIGGKVSVPHLLPYSASKFALIGFSEGLRAELAKDGILVTTAIPGLMRTGSPRNARFKGNHRAEYAWFSIGDSLPLLSMDAEAAAERILEACRHGDAEVTLGLPAQVAVRFHGLFPGLTADMLGLVNRLLPPPGGIGTRNVAGSESASKWSPSFATRLTERAAVRNNEIAPGTPENTS